MQTQKSELSDGLGPAGFSAGSPSPSHPGPDCPLPQQWDPMETPMSRNLHTQPAAAPPRAQSSRLPGGAIPPLSGPAGQDQ